MNRKSWLIALAALVLGAGAAVAVTQGLRDESTVAAPPTGDSDDQESKDSREKKKDADGQKSAEQQVEQAVNTYVEALEQGDSEALCNIQAEAFSVKVTASGLSGEEIAEACAEAASQFDWQELWAAWARQIDLEDVEVDIHGADAKVSLTAGGSFSLDRQRSGEWKLDGVRLPTAGSGSNAPQAPGGEGRPSGGGDLPSPQIPQSPQVPQPPQLPQR